LIWTPYPLTISQVIHDVKKVSARRLHERRGTEGPVWQHQFWDRFVRHAKEFNERLTYMHFNPVRKGLVNHPEEWRWSSYNNFALDRVTVRQCPIQIDYLQLSEQYRG
jgi:putative transposase